MYSSPIELIYQDLETSFEDKVLKATQAVDIQVNKDELIKALQFDRQQYDTGYIDGKAEALTNIYSVWDCETCSLKYFSNFESAKNYAKQILLEYTYKYKLSDSIIEDLYNMLDKISSASYVIDTPDFSDEPITIEVVAIDKIKIE